MPSEAKAPQLGRTRLVTGLVAFILTFALGGAASLLLVSQFKTTVEETAGATSRSSAARSRGHSPSSSRRPRASASR